MDLYDFVLILFNFLLTEYTNYLIIVCLDKITQILHLYIAHCNVLIQSYTFQNNFANTGIKICLYN